MPRPRTNIRIKKWFPQSPEMWMCGCNFRLIIVVDVMEIADANAIPFAQLLTVTHSSPLNSRDARCACARVHGHARVESELFVFCHIVTVNWRKWKWLWLWLLCNAEKMFYSFAQLARSVRSTFYQIHTRATTAPKIAIASCSWLLCDIIINDIICCIGNCAMGAHSLRSATCSHWRQAK